SATRSGATDNATTKKVRIYILLSHKLLLGNSASKFRRHSLFSYGYDTKNRWCPTPHSTTLQKLHVVVLFFVGDGGSPEEFRSCGLPHHLRGAKPPIKDVDEPGKLAVSIDASKFVFGEKQAGANPRSRSIIATRTPGRLSGNITSSFPNQFRFARL